MRDQQSDLILGVMVASNTLHATLLRSTPRGTKVLRRFTRQWGTHFAETPDEAEDPFREFEDEEDDEDFSTIHFGDEGGDMGGGNDMFLGSEFDDMSPVEDGGNAGNASKGGGASFVLELSDILSECRDAGYGNPVLAFCTSSEYVQQAELALPREDLKGSEGSSRRKKQLYQSVSDEHPVNVEREQVAFIPMTADTGQRARYLALYPGAGDPVASTLRTMRNENSRDLPPVRFLDAEMSLYIGMARLAFRGGPFGENEEDSTEADKNTLIVRAGEEDTFVAFLQNGTLHHTEMLRSLSAYDAAETICSRVLLLQDEYGAGAIRQVLLLSEQDEMSLVESFEMFFPDARVEALQTSLPALVQDEQEEPMSGRAGVAAGAAMRLVEDGRHAPLFEDVNLLPRKLMKRRFRLPISWQNIAALVVLFCTVLFFMWRFFDQRDAIDDTRQELRRYRHTNAQQASPQVLQARIDSMNNVVQGLNKSLEVLDDLLVGSSQWSQALAKTARAIAAVEGIWVENWSPRRNQLILKGNAIARDRVVNLAQRTDGAIEKLTFAEIRDWPVYSFTLNVPIEQKLPKAARYLREKIAARRDSVQRAGNVPAAPASLGESGSRHSR